MKPDKYYLDLEERGYYNTIDKRSKDYREYKQWKANNTFSNFEVLQNNVDKQSKGLGDTIAKITKVTGFDKVVKFIAGEDCGCNERQERWNKVFRYKTVNCLSEEDYVFVTNFLNSNKSKIDFDTKYRLIDIYNKVFNTNENKNSSCSSCVAKIINNLRRYIDEYSK